jgi:DNA-damage-inducible protein J
MRFFSLDISFGLLHKVGLSFAEAVRLFYKQVCVHKGLLFDVKIPNTETLKGMHDADKRKTHKAKNVDELFNDLD